MSLFVCDNCGCVENTALSLYWVRLAKALCSQCDPEIGEWHGCFPREQYDAARHLRVVNRVRWDADA